MIGKKSRMVGWKLERVGKCPGIYEVFPGVNLLRSRRGKSRNRKVKAKKCMKKRPYEARRMCASKGLIFLTFERYFGQLTQNAKLCLFRGKSGCERLPFDNCHGANPFLLISMAEIG